MDTFQIICETLNQVAFKQFVKAFRKSMSDAADSCRISIRNGPNYPQQVSVCTLTKKIRLVKNFIPKLNRYVAVPGVANDAKTLLVNYRQMLIELNKKLISSRASLVKRQRTIPVSMSSKPSPERYNPKREIRGME